jgi:aminopeptidase N
VFRPVLFLLAGCFLALPLRAADNQEKGSLQCSKKKMSVSYVPFIGDSPNTPRHAFDVLNYKLNLDIRSCFLSPYPKSFSGSNEIKFRVDSTLSSITLNAVSTSLTIDSVRLAASTFSHSSNLLTIALNRTYTAGETTAVKIYYRHNNVSDIAFYVSNGMVFTDAEPEGARYWYPCWDKPSDKATLDLTAKTPASVKLGSNGRLADSTTIADTTWFHWVSRDPVSTYLVVMSAKVNYGLNITYWHKISNPNDSIPMRFYYNAGENPTAMMLRIIPMTTQYSTLFGEHPFEKNGFATLNSQFTWGGMENQTLTSLCTNCWSENLISHEYAHQWFGDMITCGTWADIWLNEGFATYCEALWYEYTGGYSSYKSDIMADASGYLSANPGWAMYNASWAVTTPSTNTLFNTAVTYNKGACVLHMLRYTLGDSLFFATLKAYATDAVNFKFGNVVTADFITKVNDVTGRDMSWFFTWVYQPNHPVYGNMYNFTNLGGGRWQVAFKARQTQTNAAFFPMPLTLTISFATGADTTFRVMNDANNQVFSFLFGRQPTSLTFDPNNDIVLKQGSTSVGATLVAPALLLPEANATQQPLSPVLSWNAIPSAAKYRLQVANDSIFTSIVLDDSTLIDTTRILGTLSEAHTYWWRVCGLNGGGAGPYAGARKFATITPSTSSYTYADAWNLVSVPLRVSDRRKSVLFPPAVSSAFAYDSTVGYVVYDTLRYARGYWLKFNGIQNVGIAGFPRTSDTVDLATGWNLVGMVSNPMGVGAVQVVPPGILATGFFGYEGTYLVADSLQPGRGYWVKAIAPGRLILNSPVARPARADRRTVHALR